MSSVVIKSFDFEKWLVSEVNSNALECFIFCSVFHPPKHMLFRPQMPGGKMAMASPNN